MASELNSSSLIPPWDRPIDRSRAIDVAIELRVAADIFTGFPDSRDVVVLLRRAADQIDFLLAQMDKKDAG